MDCKTDRWNDWCWQAENSITDLSLFLDDSKGFFNMKVTPYFMSLIDDNINCPIRKQVIPSIEEKMVQKTFYKFGINLGDSLGEEKMSPVPNLVHRYPDRVLLLVTNDCFSYCRFCTRKRLTSKKNQEIDITEALHYIKEHETIRDVLLSGGDPLTLEDEKIGNILYEIKKIEHVEIIRIGTRAPVVLPMRITDDIVDILKQFKPLWINTHFNHPKELTPEAEQACAKLIDAGIPIGNQSVLLRGVNDSPDIYKELCLKLVKNRIRPYYLYQCDLGVGIEHFRTKVDTGIKIMKELRQNITGFAIPTYVIDAPNGGGKIPIDENYIVKRSPEEVILRCNNSEYVYPETNDYINSHNALPDM